MSNLKLNISKYFEGMHKKTEAGVYAVANMGLAMAKLYTPVDTSHLVNSEIGPIISATKDQIKGTVGFNAKYAKFVHNASGKLKGQPRAHFGVTRAGVEFGGGTLNGYYWSPDAEPKFLEKGFKEIESEIPKILKAVYETN